MQVCGLRHNHLSIENGRAAINDRAETYACHAEAERVTVETEISTFG
jgi:hypothetical protein